MKHNLKVTLILLALFIATQLIALYVINFYINNPDIKIPYGFDQSEAIKEVPNFYSQFLASFITSLIIAILILLLLMKTNSVWIIRIWFFIVICFAIGISLNVLTIKSNLPYPAILALIIAVILSCLKVFKKNIFTHNLTELLIYPGIAAIFALMLNLWTTIILLILISIYDAWAVWKSGIMMKMAGFQINKVGIFGGFFLPYASKKIKQQIKLLKLKYKNNIPSSVIKKKKLKVGLAILGGGDIAYTAIAAGVFLKTTGSLLAASSVILFATLALTYLMIFMKKKKAYPAMPYLTTGIFIGMIVGWLILKII